MAIRYAISYSCYVFINLAAASGCCCSGGGDLCFLYDSASRPFALLAGLYSNYDSGDHHHPQSSKATKPNDPSCDSRTIPAIAIGLPSIIASVTGSKPADPVGSMNVVESISTGIQPSNLLINSAHQVNRRIVHRDLILFKKFGFTPSGGVNIILSGISV